MKIAVSACLLGEKVRYNGKDKRCSFLLEKLSRFAEFIPFCPEHLAFGTPREPISLFELNNKIRVISNERKIDLTERLEYFAKLEIERLKKENIDAIILKSKSPSCGLGSTDIFSKDGSIKSKGDGIFAKLCKNEFEDLVLIEEDNLLDKDYQDRLIEYLMLLKSLKSSNVSYNLKDKINKLKNFLIRK